MNEKLISKQSELVSAIAAIQGAKTLSIDTEFVRRDTYYAKLALFQLAIDTDIYIIDTSVVNIKELWLEVANSKAIKIIHSGRQDLEIMYHQFGCLPNNIFDTQIAAGFCGLRAETSYAELCQVVCGVEDMDKKLQNCNWMRRPLTERMINYAAVDVLHLNQIYNALQKIIIEQNASERFADKTYELLLNKSLYTGVIENAWRKIKYYNKHTNFIERMKFLASYRERAAQKLDIPRRFFATDDQIVAICHGMPKDDETLDKIRNLSKYILQDEYKRELFELCSRI